MSRTRKTKIWVFALTLACGVANGCGAVPLASSAGPSRVILISLDGTRPDDLRKDSLPSLLALAERGARAERLTPVAPTNTFPNHVTLVTGVSPGRHGVVNNAFFDPEKGEFFDRSSAEGWIEVPPIWSWLEGRGVRSAAYHWVGSEGPWREGLAAADWVPFSSRTPEMVKVEKILEWLDRPDPDKRPRLITSWFHGADHFGHVDGPGSRSVARALQKQDAAIKRLIQGLEDRELFETTTLIFVSDHGMAFVEEKDKVDLKAALEKSGVEARVLGSGGFASVIRWGPSRDDSNALDQIIEVAEGLGLKATARRDFPEASKFANPRFGEVIVQAPPGTAIVYEGLRLKGFHGYDPTEPSMAAILIAAGRGVLAGTPLPSVRAVDVAPTVLALLGEEVPGFMEGQPIEALVDGVGTSDAISKPGTPESPGQDE